MSGREGRGKVCRVALRYVRREEEEEEQEEEEEEEEEEEQEQQRVTPPASLPSYSRHGHLVPAPALSQRSSRPCGSSPSGRRLVRDRTVRGRGFCSRTCECVSCVLSLSFFVSLFLCLFVCLSLCLFASFFLSSFLPFETTGHGTPRRTHKRCLKAPQTHWSFCVACRYALNESPASPVTCNARARSYSASARRLRTM